MKNLLYIIAVALVFSACGNKKRGQSSTDSSAEDDATTSHITSSERSMERIISVAKDTATSFVKKNLKYPESFQLEEISVESETVPVYFNAKIQKQAKYTVDALDKFSYYKDLDGGTGLWHDDIADAVNTYHKERDVLESMCKQRILDSLDVHLVALVKYSGENFYGNRVTNKSILIIDPENGQKILGDFDVDDDFIKNYIVIMNVLGIEIPENEYGKTDVESLPRIDRFILGE